MCDLKRAENSPRQRANATGGKNKTRLKTTVGPSDVRVKPPVRALRVLRGLRVDELGITTVSQIGQAKWTPLPAV